MLTKCVSICVGQGDNLSSPVLGVLLGDPHEPCPVVLQCTPPRETSGNTVSLSSRPATTSGSGRTPVKKYPGPTAWDEYGTFGDRGEISGHLVGRLCRTVMSSCDWPSLWWRLRTTRRCRRSSGLISILIIFSLLGSSYKEDPFINRQGWVYLILIFGL